MFELSDIEKVNSVVKKKFENSSEKNMNFFIFLFGRRDVKVGKMKISKKIE